MHWRRGMDRSLLNQPLLQPNPFPGQEFQGRCLFEEPLVDGKPAPQDDSLVISYSFFNLLLGADQVGVAFEPKFGQFFFQKRMCLVEEKDFWRCIHGW